MSATKPSPTPSERTLSVIIPTLGRATLDRVIDGVSALGPLQIIVVDASGGAAKVSRTDVTVVSLPSRATAGRARNAGAKRAKGEFLLFVDDDVLFTERTVRYVQRKLAHLPERTIVCGRYALDHDGANFAMRVQNHIVAYRYHVARKKGSTGWGGSCHMFLRRSDFAATGGFHPDLEAYEDAEHAARARAFGLRTIADPDFEAIHLKHDTFGTLLADYWSKTQKAYATRLRDPGVFADEAAHTGSAGGWLAAAASVPTLASAMVLPPALPLLLGLGLAGYAAVSAWRTVFRDAPLGFKLGAVAYWYAFGIVITTAAARASVGFLAERGAILARELADYFVGAGRVLWRRGKPIQLITYITGRCNLRCNHCFYKETLDKKDPGERPLGVLESAFRDAGPVLWLSIAGGEPFVRADLPDLIEAAQRECRPKVLTMPSNGWYTERTFEATQRIMQRMRRGNLFLVFSLDGPRDIHDRIRGAGSYERVERTIERLRPLQRAYPRLYIGAVTTVTPDNMHVAPDFVEQLVREFEPNFVSINLYREHEKNAPRLPDELLDAHQATLDRYESLVRRGALKDYSVRGLRILRVKEIVQKEAIQRVARHDEFVTPCTAGTLSYVIYEDGNVKPCEILDDTLGSIDGPGARSFGELVASSEAASTRRWIRDSKCRCSYECAMSTNVLFSWPLAGQLAKRTLTETLRIGHRAD